jgi:ubiquinone/menaquinone biosynthesis C-methylase UbiE
VPAKQEERAQVRQINERFLDPELDFERWKKNFEGESREVYASRKEVIAALKIRPGQSVADIGAGTGFYLWEFARAVGNTGQVYGVEISPRFLERMRKHVSDHKVDNATIVTGTAKSVELAENSVDLVFVCDTYHHFEYPQTTLASIRRALRPGGVLAIVDFERIEGKTAKWLMEHMRAGKEVFLAEIEAAGFELVEQPKIQGFKENYMLRFRVTK